MPRVKRGKTHLKRRKRILKAAKGFQWGRKNTLRLGKTAVLKAGVHAYRGRKLRKRDMRGSWQVILNASLREDGLTYSKFIGALKKKNILLDRKTLADIAVNEPKAWKKILEAVK